MRRMIVATASALVLVLAACSSSASSSKPTTTTEITTTEQSASTSTTSSSPSATLRRIDVCALASATDIATLGASGPGNPFDRPQTKGVQWDSCTWGNFTTGAPVVIIQTQQLEGRGVDALKTLLAVGDTAKNPATASPVGIDGKVYNVAILAGGGGGGVGKTVAFRTANKTLVAVSVTGETPNVAALTTLAQTVANNLK